MLAKSSFFRIFTQQNGGNVRNLNIASNVHQEFKRIAEFKSVKNIF